MKWKQYVLLVVLTIISVVFVSCGENYSEELDQLNAEVAKLQDDLDELQKTSVDNTTVISTNVGSIKKLQDDLDELQKRLDELRNDVEVDSTLIETLETQIAELQTGLDGLTKIVTGGDIVIDSVLYSPTNVFDEKITLRDDYWHSIDIGGWRLTDGEGNYYIPIRTVIEPFQTWTVDGRTFNPTGYKGGVWLANDGDCVTLLDANNNEKDRTCW